MPSDEEFEIDSNASEEDDEETIDQAEREEEGSRAEELLELEAEKDMPIEKLMAKYNGDPNPDANSDEDDDIDSDDGMEEDKTEDLDDSEGLSGASDEEMDFEDDLKEGMEPDNGSKKGLGLESLLDDSLDGQNETTAKLSDAAAIAESFQPKGNTLESTQVCISIHSFIA